ncbi:tRNA (adenosine(37)-N6)-threonylcarbamoyltransferase complex dimerization subunit type 1 TsaB [Haloechinothrix sp. LS1_15]|uniref:tRNA (adenosine(37)-N6)-threonylcarbamoyltransferase complex dimerization subunit type 1 TsaB n=1 Tax=Haloechinothrix sp. LS1_15 TaxID=2652248 RepID=UPI0029452D60|nr:tRNA (adenosine(37)-N6)-threonylcarbamoyltransferase complex dimerization subunit type 1 TsaB [Haloechinothrix sp. LS1_15]MDV6013072.1 tRNA (adenosine(37)-N6)-threonylcarbamoyltransferase complex dimerization subunit type 1 TsaB [Haloechinothrix sp. LS1_15]
MLVLAIDTSTPAVTAGVATLDTGVTVLATRVVVDARAHAELVTPHVTESVGAAGVSLRDIEAVVCGAGPGPYTGLRAGVVTAAALSHSLDVPAYPVCSLDVMAAEVEPGDPFLVVSDARRREVYWARYSGGGERDTAPRVDPPAEVPVAVPGMRAAGDGARMYESALGGTGVRVVEPRYPGVRGLVTTAAPELAEGRSPAPLAPVYLRRPHAVQPGERKRVSP